MARNNAKAEVNGIDGAAPTTLAGIKASIEESAAELERLQREREQKILALAPSSEVETIDLEIERAKRVARQRADHLRLVEAQEAQRERERRAKEQADRIERIEPVLAESRQVAAELQSTIRKSDEFFRKLIELREKCVAAWPFSRSDERACMLLGGSVTHLVTHEIFRVGSRPFLGGNPFARAEQNYPGGVSPTNELRGLPEKVRPLVDVLQEADDYASRVMRGTAGAPPTVTSDAVDETGALIQRERTTDEVKLAALLRRQMELGEDPNAEEQYNTVVAEIAALSAQIEQARQTTETTNV